MAGKDGDSNLIMHTGHAVLQNRFYNKSTAFTPQERKQLGIEARLPAAVETLEDQLARCMRQLDNFTEPLHKYAFLRALQDTNNTLFYALISRNLSKTLPVIYTPTVGAACQNFSHLYSVEHGIYVKLTDRGNVAALLDAGVSRKEIDVIVISDGSRILGLGDLGANGMGIPIGKCSLYVAGAGLDPRRVLPVCLDVGTNNDYYLKHPLYLGIREKRCDDVQFYGLLDEFMEAIYRKFPSVMVQFEDFSNNHCFDILSRYRKKYRCFNDDIQGTGAVIAAGVANAIRLSDTDPSTHVVVVYGAGSAAVGVVDSIASLLSKKFGMKRETFVQNAYLVDTRGLVTTTRGDKLASHKVAFARRDVPASANKNYSSLEAVVKAFKPTILIGLAGVGPAFTQPMVEFMASYCKRPIILPLSNPTPKAEITAEQAYKWTKGEAIVATGSPFPALNYEGKVLTPSQGNNMYVFPGIGLGATLAGVKTISEDLITAAAEALSDLVPTSQLSAGLYPPLDNIRDVSAAVAAAVMEQAMREGVACAPNLPAGRKNLIAFARRAMWAPEYSNGPYYAAVAAKL
jgi:malate dehydrogenase (oxaloacetate-decarboxylating)